MSYYYNNRLDELEGKYLYLGNGETAKIIHAHEEGFSMTITNGYADIPTIEVDLNWIRPLHGTDRADGLYLVGYAEDMSYEPYYVGDVVLAVTDPNTDAQTICPVLLCHIVHSIDIVGEDWDILYFRFI